MSVTAMNNAVLGMIAQSSSLATVSQNISNVNTTGYKTSETMFATALTKTSAVTDIFGVVSENRTLIENQGAISNTGTWSDLAINGDGLFILNTEMDGSGETLFTRDGSFELAAADSDGDGTDDRSYLVDANGYYLQGWAVSEDGTADTGALTSVYYDAGTETTGRTTSTVDMYGLLDPEATTDQQMAVVVYGPEVDGDTTAVDSTPLKLNWSPTGSNAWDLTLSIEGATVANGSMAVTFDGQGLMTSTSTQTLDVTWGDGSTSQITVDLSNILQTAGATTVDYSSQDGYGPGMAEGASVDSAGYLSTGYSNGYSVANFQIPLAEFVATNQLASRSGNVYAMTQESGDYTIEAANGGKAEIVASALESSTVQVEDQFTKMIMTQTAYTSASKVFTVADEMMQTVGDLKR